MKTLAPLILSAVGCLATEAAAQSDKADISWSQNPQTGVYTNDQTKITFPRSIAGFTQTRASTANKDGSASFAYKGNNGVITVFLSHRLTAGIPGTDDCAPRFRDGFVRMMKAANGATDLDQPFAFTLATGGKSLNGVGTTMHFVSSPQVGGPMYLEVGVVLVGDFLYYYRGIFLEQVGLDDLAAFVKELGVTARTSQPAPARP